MLRLPLFLVTLAIAGRLINVQATAHAILIDSQPAAGSILPPGQTAITLRFNSRVDHVRSRIALRAGGVETVLPISPASAADTLAATPTLTPDDNAVRWQVLAVDGHITHGELRFTVQTPEAQARIAQAPTSRVR